MARNLVASGGRHSEKAREAAGAEVWGLLVCGSGASRVGAPGKAEAWQPGVGGGESTINEPSHGTDAA